jgi:molecular chaperone GrpE (heat shock protein)
MDVYLILILLLVLAIGAIVLILWRDLRRTREIVEQLQSKLRDSGQTAFGKRLEQLDKNFVSISEKQDQELNTLWEEFENFRKELLAQSGNGINAEQWKTLLEDRIPSYSLIKNQINLIMEADSEMAAHLKAELPAYLTEDDPLPGLLDLASLPFDRVNWMDSLILPVGAILDGSETTAMEEPFAGLLQALGYSIIKPAIGEIYRPDYHDVVEQRLTPSRRGTILAINARGYSKKGSVVRKAKVVISAGQG